MARLTTDVSGGSDRGVRIHPAVNPSVGVWVESSGFRRTYKSKSTVQDFAARKRKTISYGARDARLMVQVWLATREAGDSIDDWVDNAVVVRDVRGKVYSGLLESSSFTFDADLPEDAVVGSFQVWMATDIGEV